MKPAQRRLVGRLLAMMVRALGSTWRARWDGAIELRPHRTDRSRRLVYGTWHRDILITAYLGRDLGLAVGASEHGDGDLAACAAQSLGFHVARGSSTRGAVRLLREMLQFAKQEIGDLALASDGPKGPAECTKPGVVYLAGRLGWALVPSGVAVSRAKVLRSWDRFRIPLPFARCVLSVGEPIEVPGRPSTEQVQSLISEMDRRMAAAELRARQVLADW